LFAALLCCVTSSCINDPVDEPADSPTNVDEFHIAFTLTINSPSTSRADNTTWGDTYDQDNVTYDAAINPFDISVALFDTDGHKVSVSNVVVIEVSNGVYQCIGNISEPLKSGKTYRCMVVANISDFNFDNVNTIDDLSSITYQSSILNLDSSDDRFYLPMWGVQTFEVKGSGTQEIKNINMLRSAVKCRVYFDDALLESSSEVSLESVQFSSRNTDGYVAPNGYNTAVSTETVSCDNCFNPTTAQDAYELKEVNGILMQVERTFDPVDFVSEPGKDKSSDGNMLYAVGYFPECRNISTNKAALDITVRSKNSEGGISRSTYTVVFNESSNSLRENLVRNHVYDIKIMSVEHGLTITVSPDVYWTQQYSTAEFDNNLSYQEEYGEGAIKWIQGTYSSVSSKSITLLSGVTLVGNIGFRTPIGGTVIATLTAIDADETNNPILFVSDAYVSADETTGAVSGATYTQSSIDGLTVMTLYIRAASEDISRQHRVQLNIYVRYPNGTTQKADAISGWTIVQQY
jgi:hypothetical protein